jgi:DNA replication and repair protein RecF
MLEELTPHIQQLHERIAGASVTVELSMQTVCKGGSDAERAQAFATRLAEVREREIDRGTTLIGPQSDDIRISIDGHPARTYGSRGQVRSLVLSLKLAELVAARLRGDVPLFLVDDVSSELDRARTARLVELLADLGAQVFATTTAPEHLSALPAADTLHLTVESGRILPRNS